MVKLDEVQDTVDELRREKFGNDETDKLKDECLYYMQNIWIYGVYPPQTWNCFRRKNDNTNNYLQW